MGLFNIFKKAIKVQDPIFGELSLTAFKERSKNFFTGEAFFNENNPKVGLIINSENSTPTESQHRFYKELQEIFPNLIDKMIPLITDEFQNWKEHFKINDFSSEFKIDSITIPDETTKPQIWDITFTTIHDNNHWVIVNFIDSTPDSVMIDG